MFILFFFSRQLVVEVINNIRTVKQLTIEKEILRQYTELIDQTYKLVITSLWESFHFKKQFFYRNHRNDLKISAITLGITWSLPMYILAGLYTLALSLIDNKQLEPRNMIMYITILSFNWWRLFCLQFLFI